MRMLVTGGMGFIGSNFIRYCLGANSDCRITNFDNLSYAGNQANLSDIAGDRRHTFVRGDVCDEKEVYRLARDCDAVVHFAAESHVDKSIGDPLAFVRTNVLGTASVLEAARRSDAGKVVAVSTDEVYGSVERGASKESDELLPSSPYSASKAGGDRLAYAYHRTYGLPVVITRSANNFGPYQFPEKLVPHFITNLLQNRKVPVYGDGSARRDWIYVEDNCVATELLLRKGKDGETYNIGAGNERSVNEITKALLELLGAPPESVEFVKDRQGHDLRYATDSSKLRRLGWKPRHEFGDALRQTVEWYKHHGEWWEPLAAGKSAGRGW